MEYIYIYINRVIFHVYLYVCKYIYIYMGETIYAVDSLVYIYIYIHNERATLRYSSGIWMRFLVKLENYNTHGRKFILTEFPSPAGCKNAALTYYKEAGKILTTFDSLRGKVGSLVTGNGNHCF